MRLVLHLSPSLLYRVTDRQTRYSKHHNSCLNPTTKAGSVTAGRKILRICFVRPLITAYSGLKNSSLNFYPIHLECLTIIHSHLRLGHAHVCFVFRKIFLLINLFLWQRATYPAHLIILYFVVVLKLITGYKSRTFVTLLSPSFCLSQPLMLRYSPLSPFCQTVAVGLVPPM